MRLSNILLLLLISLLIQISNSYNVEFQRKTAKDHSIPFSLKRMIRFQYQGFLKQLKYKLFWIQFECQYILQLFIDNYTLGFFDSEKTFHSLDINTIKDNEGLTLILNEMTPYHRSVADKIHLDCVYESTQTSRFVSFVVNKQTLDWYRLVQDWNAPIATVNVYQHNLSDRKLALLDLHHKTRMMKLAIQRLYRSHVSHIIKLALPDNCFKRPNGQELVYDDLLKYLDLIRTQKINETKYFILQQLATIKDKLLINLENSFKVLNETICIEKGRYYNILHPENHHLLTITEDDWRPVIKKIECIWDKADPPASPFLYRLWKFIFDYMVMILNFFKDLLYEERILFHQP